jgi:uncharacterized protein YqkB
MKNIQFCIDKAKEINIDIEALRLNNTVIKRRGGTTTVNLDGEIDFQQKRVDLLMWAEVATEDEIQIKINELTELLPPELQSPVTYLSNRLPLDIYELYCLREILKKAVI